MDSPSAQGCPFSCKTYITSLNTIGSRKDKVRSESLDDACDLIQLPWLYRKALALLNNMEVEDTEENLRTTLKAGGIMDVVCMHLQYLLFSEVSSLCYLSWTAVVMTGVCASGGVLPL